MRKPCILVIEDERRYRELLELNLTRLGYRVALAANGLEGLNLLERDAPDLVILDLMLPDLDGYEVCRRIREYSSAAIIMLTAKSEEAHKVRGLRLGADDYVTKPFGAGELLARIEAVLRRSERSQATPSGRFTSGDLTIDFAHRQVTVRGSEVDLTPLEYRLLAHLAQNVGRVLVHEELLRRVWGSGHEDQTDSLYATVRRLRRKLGDDAGAPRHVRSRRGIGYWLAKLPTRADTQNGVGGGQNNLPASES